MPKNRKLKSTWVKVLGLSIQCETIEDYGQAEDGYWYKRVRVGGETVEVRCNSHRGTFERYE